MAGIGRNVAFCYGQLDESFNLASLTHDDEPKPSDLKRTAAAHDGLIVS